VCEVSPGLTNPSIDAFDAHLLPGSPAIDAGTLSGAPPDDFDAYPRYAIATYTVEVRPIGGSASAVSLIASSPSPSLTLQLAPAQVIPPGQAILTLTDSHPGPTLPSGLWYVVPLTATDGVTQTTSVRLLVGGVRVYLPLILKSY
jgi:hypothetical protein